MRDVSKIQNPHHHNDTLSLFTSTAATYAFPSIWGGDIEEFMIFCTDSICCAPEPDITTGTTKQQQQQQQKNKDDVYVEYDFDDDDIDDARSDLVDPEELRYQREVRASALLQQEYDMNSCCGSSISSTGSMASSGNNSKSRTRVRVFFDASLATTAATTAAAEQQQQQQQQAVQQTENEPQEQ